METNKKNLGNPLALYPEPTTVARAEIERKANQLAVEHTGVIGHDRIPVSLSKSHHTNQGIKKAKRLFVNLVSRDMLPKADHVGSVSGATVDKSEAFACRTHNPTVRRKKTYALKHRRRAPQRDTATTYTVFRKLLPSEQRMIRHQIVHLLADGSDFRFVIDIREHAVDQRYDRLHPVLFQSPGRNGRRTDTDARRLERRAGCRTEPCSCSS